MWEPYTRATLFLTYIQGGNTTEWVDQLGNWLDLQVDPCNHHHTMVVDKWLWESVELAFNCQYTDKLTQEWAMAELKVGIKMQGKELDDYISHFKSLIRHAGLTINNQLVLNIFTAGLPYAMYKELYSLQPPLITYEQWRVAAIKQQKRFIHLKGQQDRFKWRLEAFKTPHNNQSNQQGPFKAPKEDNVMDTMPGRMHARMAEAEDFLPGGYRWGQATANPNNQRWMQGNNREVICFNCNKPGHIACNCPHNQQQPQQQHQWQPHPGPSHTCQSKVNENHEQVCTVCNDRTAEQRAQDWLSNIANKQDDIKELVMQQVLGGGDGQDF